MSQDLVVLKGNLRPKHHFYRPTNALGLLYSVRTVFNTAANPTNPRHLLFYANLCIWVAFSDLKSYVNVI